MHLVIHKYYGAQFWNSEAARFKYATIQLHTKADIVNTKTLTIWLVTIQLCTIEYTYM